MSYKPYLIPLSKKRGVKQVQLKAEQKNISLIPFYVVKSKAGKRYAAVSINWHYDDVVKMYGKGVKYKPITKSDVNRGRYKILYQRKPKRRKRSKR